jgi:hypothetical protein
MKSEVFSVAKQSVTVIFWVMTPCSLYVDRNAPSRLSSPRQTTLRHNPEYTVWVKVSTCLTLFTGCVQVTSFKGCFKDFQLLLLLVYSTYIALLSLSLRLSTECCIMSNPNCQLCILIHKIGYTSQTAVDYFLFGI